MSIKVSVIMPVYNADKYLQEAIDSIIYQSMPDFELICIEDGSTDDSKTILERQNDPRIVILYNDRNQGISYSTNRGLEIARGKYVALLDDDDIALCERLKICTEYLDSHQDIDFVSGNYEIYNEEAGRYEDNHYLSLHNPLYIKAEMMFSCVIRNGSAMYRKSFVEKSGVKYKDNCFGMQDYMFWTDCLIAGARMTVLDDKLYIQRKHANRETIRVINNNKESRNKKYKEIQEHYIEGLGFDLTTEEKDCIFFFFGENRGIAQRFEDLEFIYLIFNKMIKQARQKNFDNTAELKIVFYKRLFDLTYGNKAVIWKED